MSITSEAPLDPDDLDSMRRALLQRDLLIERLRKELVLAERWAAGVITHAHELIETAENTQGTLLATAELLPDDIQLAAEVEELRYALGE